MKSYLFILLLFLVNIVYCQNITVASETMLDSTEMDTSLAITIYYNDGSSTIHSQLRMEISWGYNNISKRFKVETILIDDKTTIIKAASIDRIISHDGKVTTGKKLRMVSSTLTAAPYVIVGIIISLVLIL